MKVCQQMQVAYDSEQSPRAFAEDWFRAYAAERLEEPADKLLEESARLYGDIVLVGCDDTWESIAVECGCEQVLVAIGPDVLLWTEPDPDDEQVVLLDDDPTDAALSNNIDFDSDGFDIYGFSVAGTHRNGTMFDDDGFNCHGFGVDGYDRDGFDRHNNNKPLPDELAMYDPTYEWCDIVTDHKRNGRYDDALVVLDGCIRVDEFLGEAAPWYYEQAAIIHRKRGDRFGELAVLRRFATLQHGPGAKPPKLLERLAKLEASGSQPC